MANYNCSYSYSYSLFYVNFLIGEHKRKTMNITLPSLSFKCGLVDTIPY